MRLSQEIILSAGDMSQATLTSDGLDLQQVPLASIHAVFTGSPVGTLTLEVSNDKVAAVNGSNQATNVTTWTTYTGSSQSISASGDFLYNLLSTGYRWIRLKYTRTSGTGSLTVTSVTKGV